MKIKVCGLRDTDNIKAVEALAPDYMGFICYDNSPRFIGGMDDDELVKISPILHK
jgi:phosphoribosylanthranilate isomerase